MGLGGKEALDKQKGPVTLGSRGFCGISFYLSLRFRDIVPLSEREGADLERTRGSGDLD